MVSLVDRGDLPVGVAEETLLHRYFLSGEGVAGDHADVSPIFHELPREQGRQFRARHGLHLVRVGHVGTCQRHDGGVVDPGLGHESAYAGCRDYVESPDALSFVHGGYSRNLRSDISCRVRTFHAVDLGILRVDFGACGNGQVDLAGSQCGESLDAGVIVTGHFLRHQRRRKRRGVEGSDEDVAGHSIGERHAVERTLPHKREQTGTFQKFQDIILHVGKIHLGLFSVSLHRNKFNLTAFSATDFGHGAGHGRYEFDFLVLFGVKQRVSYPYGIAGLDADFPGISGKVVRYYGEQRCGAVNGDRV